MIQASMMVEESQKSGRSGAMCALKMAEFFRAGSLECSKTASGHHSRFWKNDFMGMHKHCSDPDPRFKG
jgi:hypothetical protein